MAELDEEKLCEQAEMLVYSSHDAYQRLMKMRGGCRCQDPNAMPPCGNCTAEITIDEAEELLDLQPCKDIPKTKVAGSW